MAIAATDLVKRAARHFGSQTKLAEAMDLGANGGSTVSRWANGVHALDYEHVIQILELCGWLAIEEGASVARIEPPDARLESIVEMVKETLANTNKLLEASEPQRKAAPRRPKQKRSG